MDIKYKSGEFRSFVATRSFALGAFNITVAKESSLSFDGSTAEYAGTTYAFPQLRSAVTAGWLVLSEEYEEGNPEYGRPVSANMKVRPATDDKGKAKSVAVTTEADEQIVMNTAEHASETREKNKALKSTSPEIIEDQEGVPVRSLKTAAKSKTELTAASVGKALQDAQNVQIDPGKGQTEAEMLERMTPEARETYLAQKTALRSRHVVDTTVTKVGVEKTKETEGMKLTQQVGGGVEIADPLGTGEKPKESSRVEDGITFKTTNIAESTKQASPHPRAVVKSEPNNESVDIRVRLARNLCPQFPDSYNFSDPPKKKLARLQADFEDRLDIIRAVFAVESTEFKVKLVEEFPKAFEG
jgi:hypothetical protein